MSHGILVHVGTYGDYVVPAHLHGIRMNRRGWPDKRYAKAAEYMAWVRDQEAAESLKIRTHLTHLINRIGPEASPLVAAATCASSTETL